MALITSAMAAKALRRLNESRDALLLKEQKSCIFTAAVQEELESVRPAYDFAAVQAELAALEEKIRRLKHALNLFNAATVVPGFDMTIDQMLVYIPQLTARKRKLEAMSARLPKERETQGMGRTSGIIEYSYCNYPLPAAEAAARAAAEELARAQNALDTVNATALFEAELD